MRCQLLDNSRQVEIETLFTSTFALSEGVQEGALIGGLAAQLAVNVDNHTIICIGACEEEVLVGCAFFTILRFGVPVRLYLLAPVAVAAERQGEGIGQALIRFGLEELIKRSADAVVTYGDPSFYAKVGFQPLSERVIQAPLKLSMPFGWLGQSLTAEPIPAMGERPQCVKEFDNPAYW